MSKSSYVGHGKCSHEMPATCDLLGTNEGDRKFRSTPWKPIKGIRNAGGCAQTCASTEGCTYWLVHKTQGCWLNDGQKGSLLMGKMALLYHGSCTRNPASAPSTSVSTSAPAADKVCPGGATYNFEPPIPNRQGITGFELDAQPQVGGVRTVLDCALLCIGHSRCAGFVFGNLGPAAGQDLGGTADATPSCSLYSAVGVRGMLPKVAGMDLYLSRHLLINKCRDRRV